MEFCLYRSTCVSGMFELPDLDIMRVALRRNAALGLSGFLYRNRRHYFQFIEGPAQELRLVLNRIETDRRHYAFQILRRGATTRRRFGRWSMGYVAELDEGLGRAIENCQTNEDVIQFLRREADLQERALEGKLRGERSAEVDPPYALDHVPLRLPSDACL